MENAFPPGLEKDVFRIVATNQIHQLIQTGGDAVTLSALNRRGFIPIGVVAERPFGECLTMPHVMWYPEASPRNRLEATVQYFAARKDKKPAVVFARLKYVPFFDHVCRYGLLRPAGTLRGLYPDEDGRIYQTT